MEYNDANERIKKRREELGLEESEVADSAGLNIYWYGDVEGYPHEPFQQVSLRQIKAICRALQMKLLPLFDIPCAFCEQGSEFRDEFTLPRNELIRKARKTRGLSPKQFGKCANFTVEGVRLMEEDPDCLEDSSEIDRTLLVAKALDVPFQVLAAVKCGKCGK